MTLASPVKAVADRPIRTLTCDAGLLRADCRCCAAAPDLICAVSQSFTTDANCGSLGNRIAFSLRVKVAGCRPAQVRLQPDLQFNLDIVGDHGVGTALRLSSKMLRLSGCNGQTAA